MARNDIVLLSDEERIAFAWAGRLRGKSYESIFLEMQKAYPGLLPLDYNLTKLQKDISFALEKLKPAYMETASELVQIEAQRFDVMLDAVWDKVEKGDTRAIDTALNISKERRKMLGLDESEKLQVDFRVTLAEYMRDGKLTPAEIQEEFGTEILTEVNYKLLELK